VLSHEMKDTRKAKGKKNRIARTPVLDTKLSPIRRDDVSKTESRRARAGRAQSKGRGFADERESRAAQPRESKPVQPNSAYDGLVGRGFTQREPGVASGGSERWVRMQPWSKISLPLGEEWGETKK